MESRLLSTDNAVEFQHLFTFKFNQVFNSVFLQILVLFSVYRLFGTVERETVETVREKLIPSGLVNAFDRGVKQVH